MLAVDFHDIGTSSFKRDQCPVSMEEEEVRGFESSPIMIKRQRRNYETAKPAIKNRLLHLQHDNELKELRFNLEKKDKELQEKTVQIQQLQAQVSSSSSKAQQFDALAKAFMEQNTKLKTKEEEISSLTTVIQKLLAENRSLKNQLFLIDRQNLSSMFDS
ncbi:hypothetical protein WA538_004961 [Blastocystis sp. DL]